MDFTLLLLIVFLALIFDYINGFHDAANAIAAVVSTKVLSPRAAVLYGASLNLVGAMLGTQVASTIGKGIVDPHIVTPEILICALLGAIIWNLFTWYLGLPSSSSHALIGALCGAAVFATGTPTVIHGLHSIKWAGLLDKVIMPMLVSPVVGIILGFSFMLSLTWLLHKVLLSAVNKWARKLQIVSAGFIALSHGSNDAQKSMGIIALAIATYYHTPFEVANWTKLACALAMGLGTLSGGWKIIRTLATKMIKLQPIQGFASDTTSGAMILTASHFGIPLSTTQVISTVIMGVGATRRFSAVKWGIVGNIVWAWILTIPLTFILSGGIYWVYNRLWH